VSHSQQDLLNALMAAPRFGYRLSPYMYSSLMRPYTPLKPANPRIPRIVRPDPDEAPVAVEQPREAPAAIERLGGVTMRLDISVWRLPHLWRLVASLWVRRT
jgi:hypothetical protein